MQTVQLMLLSSPPRAVPYAFSEFRAVCSPQDQQIVALSSLSASAVRETCLHTPSLSAGTTLTQGNAYFYLGGIFTQGPWQGVGG